MSTLYFGRENFTSFEAATQSEWLVTNGIGGFAGSTLACANTRRYHGLLCAALNPPSERTLLVSNLDEQIRYRDRTHALSSNEYVDGTVHPLGYQSIQQFSMEDGLPSWTIAVDDVLLQKRVWMAPHENTSYIEYSLIHSSDPVELNLRPLCCYRDYHWHQRGERYFEVEARSRGFTFKPAGAKHTLFVETTYGTFYRQPLWSWNYLHRQERERGLDDAEDLFSPGSFVVSLQPGQSLTMAFSTQPDALPRAASSRKQLWANRKERLSRLPPKAPWWYAIVSESCEHFIIQRKIKGAKTAGATTAGTSVIAGYPWFTDWARDTMIALPGLTIARGKPELAREVLTTFATFVDQGMLPNRFLDGAEQLEFNSVDGALQFFYSVYEYYLATKDLEFLVYLYPTLCDIIDNYTRGTRYGIRVDEADGLLNAGEAGVQLTWMDVKIGEWVVTPRSGKAVEINALWYNALEITKIVAAAAGDDRRAEEFTARAQAVRESFQKFWNASAGCLFDVLAAEPDPAIRPNQLYAVGLRFSPLTPAQKRQVVDVCTARLVTAVGLRSLSPDHPAYRPHYGGNPQERDSSYHQGTVWAFLMGIYVRAHMSVYNEPDLALSYLQGLISHLREAGIGHVSEVFDAEPPHRANGCFAQAWSNAELLYAWWYVEKTRSEMRKLGDDQVRRTPAFA